MKNQPEISEIIERCGASNVAEKVGCALRTAQSWATDTKNKRTPPPWVVRLIDFYLKFCGMKCPKCGMKFGERETK